MKEKISGLAEEFAKYAIKFEETQQHGNFQDGNFYSAKIMENGDKMKSNYALAVVLLDKLLTSNLPSVLLHSCLYALLVNYRTQEALILLEKIVREGNGLTGFTADITLELYGIGELFELHGIRNWNSAGGNKIVIGANSHPIYKLKKAWGPHAFFWCIIYPNAKSV
ncbi:hypothetical protein ACQCVP_13190 [Rossellomorea vietnamensis]|uniref:hypothetical protein n=1 Tax=Rossellomorea vietnamensis TaxID=218284 RepID=UPI003CF4E5C0